MIERHGISCGTPASEPVTTAEAKVHLRVEHAADDGYIAELITAARELVEAQYDRTLVTTTITVTLPGFFCDGGPLRLPRGPLRSVTSISYLDSAGDVVTLDPARYRVDATADPGTVTPAWGHAWPVARPIEAAVTVVYSAGYGAAADVPRRARQAVLMLVAHWYDEGRPAAIAGTLSPVPMGVEALMTSVWNGEY